MKQVLNENIKFFMKFFNVFNVTDRDKEKDLSKAVLVNKVVLFLQSLFYN